jgi:succinoglycan biosynthesis transport protein ExoP
MDEEAGTGKDFREYLALLRRRRGQILAVAAGVVSIAITVALALPPVFRSSATILVQEQEIPPDLVRSTVTSFADERIQVISQQVMTRAVLLQLVDKHDLYEKYRKRGMTEEIVERMHRDIKLSTIDASVSDRSSGRRVNATIAFRISYDAPDPERAQSVVHDLVSLYLEENVKARQQSVAQTTAFLAEEAERLASQIQEIEANLATFKRRNAGRLPDSAPVNMQLADRMQSELLRVEREISMLQERKVYLETQLPLINPNLPAPTNTPGETLTAEDRLRTLQAQYASSAARYGADHPDIRRLQREIAALKAEVGSSGDADATERLSALEAELATLKERYSEDHPDVQRVRRSIAALKASQGNAPRKRSERQLAGDANQRPGNPAYIALISQLESTKRELVHLSALKEDLRAKQRDYDARLLQIPEIEREYRDLTRDYDNAQARYREVKAKQMQAQVAVELEKDRRAERFTLSEQPNLPQRPISPDRPRIVLGGLVASLGAGLGLAWLRDLFDRSVKGPWTLARIAPVPILTPIPYIETEGERRRNRRRAWIVGCIVVLIALGFLVGVHLFLRTLPDVWEAVTRRIGIW